MIIDKEFNFDTEKDELQWCKIITIEYGCNNKSTHVVHYYITEDNEEYYLFDYIMADNNGSIVNNFNDHHWQEMIKQINFSDYSYIYSQSISNLNEYHLTTRGKLIKKRIREDII